MPNIILDLKPMKEKASLPIEAETISPDSFLEKSLEEIGELTVWRGNKELPLKDLFKIIGDDSLGGEVDEISIEINGSIGKIKRIGQAMTGGKIVINSSVGMHTGFQMKGGSIIVNGDADDFAGANMNGGELTINGNAHHYLGGSVRGDWRGMSKGIIRVSGNARNECGIWMRNGIIEITGNAEMFLGMHMHRGVIVVSGDVTERVGAEMTGGIIAIKGKLDRILPSFELQGKKADPELKDYGVLKGSFLEYKGDFAERKQGYLYLLESSNKHLL